MRRPPDLLLLLVILALVGFGILMVASASSVLGIDLRADPHAFAKRQFFYGILPGLTALIVAVNIPYGLLKKIVVPLLAVVILLLVLVFVPGLQGFYGGAARWVRVGPLSIQPAELAKLSLILYLAALLAGREARHGHVREALLPFLITVGVVAVLIAAQPDIGTLVVVTGASLFMYALAGAPWSHLVSIVIFSSATLLALVRAAPYRVARFITFLRPEADPTGIGYQIQQALLAIGSGGIWGLGLGRSRQKFRYLPEPAGDAIFSIASEELGFLRITLFLLLYAFLIIRGYQIARSAPDAFGRFVAAGITSWFFVQMTVHIGANMALLPLTGIPLPFVSYGGSALVTAMAGAGILLNMSRYSKN
jgi:cell division protein FtsW